MLHVHVHASFIFTQMFLSLQEGVESCQLVYVIFKMMEESVQCFERFCFFAFYIHSSILFRFAQPNRKHFYYK